jgi:acetyl esterase/lipase
MKLLRHICLLLLAGQIAFGADVAFKRTEDVVYGRKFGVALTMDVFTPEQKNGCGVFYMVSGGWFSSHDAINPGAYKELLNRGYTVFAVVHGSQPKFTVMEIREDIHRAIRFVRFNADKYGVNPNKLGITGASAGGHLTLTMATEGKPGKADAKDPIDRASSAVQAAACFFPPTDFLNYGKEGEDAVGVGTLKDFKPGFGALSDWPETRQILGKVISPIYFVTKETPPCLIIHGDADKLVPIQQAETFVAKAKSLGVTAELVTKPGKAHGWAKMEEDMATIADWFDQFLRGIAGKGGAK